MRKFFGRVNRRLKMTIKQFRSDSHFSIHYAWLRVFHELGGRLHLHRLSAWAYGAKNHWILRYLEKSLKPILDRYKEDNEQGEYHPNAPVWVCWWSGEDTAPALVRQCIKSIRECAGSHPVYLITEDNYQEYLSIPNYILSKLASHTMCVANFSDYLRFSLLAKYGGLWLDATIYCSSPLKQSFFSMPVFSCKGKTGAGEYISDYRWTSFCFGGYQNNVLFRYMQSAFESYWKQNDVSIDYLLVDYLLDLGYSKVSCIKDCLDKIPENNMRRDNLQAAMNDVLPAEEFEHVLGEDTSLYKLSWRESYRTKTQDGRDTVFSFYIKGLDTKK